MAALSGRYRFILYFATKAAIIPPTINPVGKYALPGTNITEATAKKTPIPILKSAML